jgi:hypothetical protein
LIRRGKKNFEVLSPNRGVMTLVLSCAVLPNELKMGLNFQICLFQC